MNSIWNILKIILHHSLINIKIIKTNNKIKKINIKIQMCIQISANLLVWKQKKKNQNVSSNSFLIVVKHDFV